MIYNRYIQYSRQVDDKCYYATYVEDKLIF